MITSCVLLGVLLAPLKGWRTHDFSPARRQYLYVQLNYDDSIAPPLSVRQQHGLTYVVANMCYGLSPPSPSHKLWKHVESTETCTASTGILGLDNRKNNAHPGAAAKEKQLHPFLAPSSRPTPTAQDLLVEQLTTQNQLVATLFIADLPCSQLLLGSNHLRY
jgi:hypothetical protein